MARQLTESFEESPTARKPVAKAVPKPAAKAVAKKSVVAKKTTPGKKVAKAVGKPSTR
jgi:hypothetical protein